MKRIITICLLACGLGSFLYAEKDCTKMPDVKSIEKAFEVKSYEKAKELLAKFKIEVKTYLDTCDNSKDMFEQTSVNILTYEDKLLDLEEDLKSTKNTIDCTNIPDDKTLDEAFKKANDKQIKIIYANYKKDTEGYLDQCAAHEEYEIVFDATLLYEERYAKWEKSKS
ncbi:MAG: hypothetical protein DRQ78_06455 [Epsilonproteobacteria bacterium]|nr:MAG: hypothetical protein DRQ78_06455 [Campylobacterota bacterium]